MHAGKLIEISLEFANKISQPRKSPMEQQQKVLQELLHASKRTAFGKYYHFDEILGQKDFIGEFQKRVPFHDYNKMYDDWWRLTLEGKSNVTWPGKVKYYALSSGTSSATSKKIPVTADMIKSLKKGAFKIYSALPNFDLPEKAYVKSWLAIGGSARLTKEGKHYLGYLSGINANQQPFWAKLFYKPGDKIARIEDWDDRLKLIAKYASDWDVSVLVGIPHWIQMVLEGILERYHLKSIDQLWPGLSLIVTGGVAYEPYRMRFEELIGHPVQSLDTYLASEGLIAFQKSAGAEGMELILNNDVFFEFVPFTEENFDDNGDLIGRPRALTIEEIETGVDYALFISTPAGAWRYIIGDTVRFLDKHQCEIIISGRTKHYLNLCTEHVTVDNLNAAIEQAQQLLNVSIPEYTVAGLKKGNYFTHRWYIGLQKPYNNSELLRKTLDEALKQVNDDYQSERGTALDIEVVLLPVRLFYEWQSVFSSAAGQAKIPRVMKGRQLNLWEKFLAKADNKKLISGN